jgi:flagellar protein FliO/FliZ
LDIKEYLTAILALVFVLGLILAATHLARRIGLGSAVPGRRGRKRLSISEALVVDGKRRLLLIRRDQTEHLVMVGGGSDLVIETGIAAPPPDPAAAQGERM